MSGNFWIWAPPVALIAAGLVAWIAQEIFDCWRARRRR